MNNAYTGIFPLFLPEQQIKQMGLTKRELFSAIFFHGLLANQWNTKQISDWNKLSQADQIKTMATLSIQQADAVLAQLK